MVRVMKAHKVICLYRRCQFAGFPADQKLERRGDEKSQRAPHLMRKGAEFT